LILKLGILIVFSGKIFGETKFGGLDYFHVHHRIKFLANERKIANHHFKFLQTMNIFLLTNLFLSSYSLANLRKS